MKLLRIAFLALLVSVWFWAVWSVDAGQHTVIRNDEIKPLELQRPPNVDQCRVCGSSQHYRRTMVIHGQSDAPIEICRFCGTVRVKADFLKAWGEQR